MPSAISTAANLTIGYFGTGPKPILSGGTIRADWSYDAGNNIYSRPAYGSNILGNVTEDDVPMRFTAWNTNIATTAAAMTAGANLPYWSGSMTYDPVNFIVYIRPSSNPVSSHTYIVSEVLWAIYVSGSVSGLLIDGLDIRNISRHGITAFNRKKLIVQDTDFRVMGGLKPGASYMGNGIEFALGTDGAKALRCKYYDIFDSGATSQLYETVPRTLTGHYYENNYAERYGLTGIEISCQSANQQINDVEINGLTCLNGQANSWGGDRGIGSAVSFLCNGSGSIVTRGFIRRMLAQNQRRSYIGFQHGGVNGIEDSIAFGSYLSAPLSSVGSAGPQKDIYRSFTDDFGGASIAPSGGSWSSISAQMSNTFIPVYL
jgi:hypothetical protein